MVYVNDEDDDKINIVILHTEDIEVSDLWDNIRMYRTACSDRKKMRVNYIKKECHIKDGDAQAREFIKKLERNVKKNGKV